MSDRKFLRASLGDGLVFFCHRLDEVTISLVKNSPHWTAFRSIDQDIRRLQPDDHINHFETVVQELSLIEPNSTQGCARALTHLLDARVIGNREVVQAMRLATGSSCAFRSGFVWVGGDHPTQAWYVAPPSSDVPRLMKNLMDFISDTRVPVCAKAIIAYVQLLHIHPFADGNGRVARAIFIALFARELRQGRLGTRTLIKLLQFRGMRMDGAKHELLNTGSWESCFSVYVNAVRAEVEIAGGEVC